GAGADMEIDDLPSDKKTIRPRRNLEKKEERPRFSLTLSCKEIEDDFFAMTGKKLPRRPKRRSRAVQAQINQRVKRIASMNTRLNIEKLDGNIVQKLGGSKQVGFKQLGPGVETGVHRVHDKKRVWLEVKLHGAQGDREAEVFQVSNDDTIVTQRQLKDKQPEEKTNTDCLIKDQEKEYKTMWKIKTSNVFYFCNQRSIQQCTNSGVAKHLGVAVIQQPFGLVKETNVTLLAKVCCFLIQFGLSKVLWAEDTTRSTYIVNRSPSSAIGFKKPIDMNIGFNESKEYKKTFIGSVLGTGSMQVLHRFEFEVEPLGDHTFEGATLSCELFGYREDSNGAAFAVPAVEKIYAHKKYSDDNDGYY
nr:hypothetical protein [Tanacetum cinerariifolium]